MLGRWTKGLLHLLVGGACAALVGWLTFGFTQTLAQSDGAVRTAMTALVLLALAVVGVLLLASPVRPAEVALARTLLDVPLPEPVDTTSPQSRGRGMAWAVAVIVLGGLSLLALLWCLPQGAGVLVAAGADRVRADLPGPVAEMPAAALALLGVLLVGTGVGVQPLLVTALRRLAPVLLGPTPADRIAHAEQERYRLLQANNLARELHDSVGHALTAIGVQAEAGARVADRDPSYARSALERIARTTREAVAELDEVLGTLRQEPSSAPAASLADLLAELDPEDSGSITYDVAGGALDGTVARTAYRVVQEALTNARRHGTGPPSGSVRAADGAVRVLVENPMAAAGKNDHQATGASETPGGRGLVGMRERLALVGGTLSAGPVTLDGQRRWRLEARFPGRPGDATPTGPAGTP